MRPERPFVAERVAALHCAELLRRREDEVDLVSTLDGVCRALAARLGAALAQIGGDAADVSPSPALEMDMHRLLATVGPLAGNSLVGGHPSGAAFLVSIDAGAILRLVDRSFGGNGDLPAQLPAQFSMSAQLAAARIERAVFGALAPALGLSDPRQLSTVRSEASLAALAPFEPDARIVACTLDIGQGTDAPWSLTLAFPAPVLAGLCSGAGSPGPSGERAARPGATDQPFAQIPVPIRAVLVDMKLPLDVVSRLQPGQVLPVAVARNVPLMAGGTILARGAVGELDDRIALKITQLP